MASLLATQEERAKGDAAAGAGEGGAAPPTAEDIAAGVLGECEATPALRARFSAPQFGRVALRRHLNAASYARGAPSGVREEAVALILEMFGRGGGAGSKGPGCGGKPASPIHQTQIDHTVLHQQKVLLPIQYCRQHSTTHSSQRAALCRRLEFRQPYLDRLHCSHCFPTP